jgi:hypothetical protein
MTPEHPASEVPRQLVHRLDLSMQAYRREDGLHDLEVVLTDVKPHTFSSSKRVFLAGVPVHRMTLCVTIDDSCNIVRVAADMPSTPFPGVCPAAVERMQCLVGCNLWKGFSRELTTQLGPADRCSHLVMMAKQLPALAVQALMHREPVSGQRPLKIDGCHAWQASGVLVKEHLPEWYTGSAP